MVEQATEDESAIVCHKTLYGGRGRKMKNAICRGFFDKHPTAPLQIADRLGLIEYV